MRPRGRRPATPTAVTAEAPQYALQAGVESSFSQGVRRFDLRRSRYIGLARTHLQQLLNAIAMNVVRVIAWYGASLWVSAGGSQDTLPSSRPILCHVRP
jgi:hypothetical protein